MITIERRTKSGAVVPQPIDDAAGKLAWRASLPGASTFDRAAHVLRALQAEGMPAEALLSLAMPASWTVNAKATSRAFQAWLGSGPGGLPVWTELLAAIPFDLSAEGWLAQTDAERARLTPLVSALTSGERANGASLAAVSKVLALLRPQLVPLMDDAAIAFAIELVATPVDADQPAAPATCFVPMLDWFAGEVVRLDRELVALAASHDQAVLDGAQALDRLVWMESWGQALRVSRRL